MLRNPWGRPIGGPRYAPSPWAAPAPPPARRPAPSFTPPPRTPAATPTRREDVDDETPFEARRHVAVDVEEPAPIATASAEAVELRRARAEVEATKARIEREALREADAARLRLVGELLPALDDLNRTIAAGKAAAGAADVGLLQGVELVRARIERVLEGYGLQRIDAVGQPFDPAVHEAIAVTPVSEPARDGAVVDELGRGYRVGERVLRPARVRVGKLEASA